MKLALCLNNFCSHLKRFWMLFRISCLFLYLAFLFLLLIHPSTRNHVRILYWPFLWCRLMSHWSLIIAIILFCFCYFQTSPSNISLLHLSLLQDFILSDSWYYVVCNLHASTLYPTHKFVVRWLHLLMLPIIIVKYSTQFLVIS